MLVAVVLGGAVVGGAVVGGADAASAVSRVVPALQPADCPALLSGEQAAFVGSIGALPTVGGAPGGGPDSPVWAQPGALLCSWGGGLQLGVAPVTAAEEEAIRAAMLVAPDADGVYSDGVSAWAQQSLLADGAWYVAYRLGRDNGTEIDVRALRERVLALAPPAAVPDAPEDTPGLVTPVEADDGFAADQPSVLSALRTPGDGLSPTQLAAGIAATLVLIAVVALPGKLMESAVLGNRDRIAAWATGRLPALGRLRLPVPPSGRGWRVASIAAVIAVGAVMAAFIDPRIGLEPGTPRLIATTTLGFVLEGLVGAILVGAVLRVALRGPGWRVVARPSSLLVVLGAVVLSRVTGFEPGFVFGVVVGVALAAGASERDELSLGALEIAWLWLLGIGAWLLYGAAASGPLLLVETAGAVAVGSLTALILLLMPWRGLPGGVLYRRTRAGWFGVYGVSALAFALIVLPLPNSWDEVDAPFGAWIGVVLAYAVVAIGVWALATFGPWSRAVVAPRSAT